MNNNKDKNNDTTWGKVANWYDGYLNDPDSYQAKVIYPNLFRLLNLKTSDSVLEIGCGQGYFLNKFYSHAKNLTGIDIGQELIDIAKSKNKNINYIVCSADDENILPEKSFDIITIILALQNIKNLDAVSKNVSRLLKKDGRAYIVLNHPTFRIPQHSDWGFDEKKKNQYRKIDAYLSQLEIHIDMNPGAEFLASNSASRRTTKFLDKKQFTKSFHRSLQVYSKSFVKNNLVISKIEEWISHKKSKSGARADAEDLARKEIPMFMCLELKKYEIL
ncbi:MAG TPA: class I SAM-dependent methyltransferase [Candidatus Paceibacterota bacterium]|nr:class I SAM-dependent methyltransferase [Candidatus Paceibacterota bacterium]